jgi:hypothetical protein
MMWALALAVVSFATCTAFVVVGWIVGSIKEANQRVICRLDVLLALQLGQQKQRGRGYKSRIGARRTRRGQAQPTAGLLRHAALSTVSRRAS